MEHAVQTSALEQSSPQSQSLLNGMTGDVRSYANITAVGALIVFMVMSMGLLSYMAVVFIDSHRELTKAFREVAVELKVMGEKNTRDAAEFRREMRDQSEETHKLIRALTKKE